MTKLAIQGHNTFASTELARLVERVERLAEEKQAIADDISEVYAEAKTAGFDTAVMRKVIQARKKPEAEREEAEAIFDLYMSALRSHSQLEAAKSLEEGV